jgi:hypothetical protein
VTLISPIQSTISINFFTYFIDLLIRGKQDEVGTLLKTSQQESFAKRQSVARSAQLNIKVFPNGDMYEGFLVKDVPHGKGKMIYTVCILGDLF